MAETEQHTRPVETPIVGEERELPRDWANIDRLIMLMSLALAKRLLRRTRRIPTLLKTQIEDRIDVLIEHYKHPVERGF